MERDTLEEDKMRKIEEGERKGRLSKAKRNKWKIE